MGKTWLGLNIPAQNLHGQSRPELKHCEPKCSECSATRAPHSSTTSSAQCRELESAATGNIKMRLSEMQANVLLTEVLELILVEEMTSEHSKGVNAAAHSCLLCHVLPLMQCPLPATLSSCELIVCNLAMTSFAKRVHVSSAHWQPFGPADSQCGSCDDSRFGVSNQQNQAAARK